MAKIAKNTVCLWYDGTAEDAARFYAATFPDSSVDAVYRAPGDFPSGKQGDVLTVLFTVMGIPCLGLNGGPAFRHNEAFSFQVATADQAETDRYWHAIVGNGGEESACGWCKDKWGVSWQITPLALTEAITDPDPAAAKRAFDAMMTMQKIDIATIQAARRMKTVKPNRVTRTYTQRLVAAPSSVLPLLCPVREADWIVGWDPLLVVSQSGLAERDCVFITSAEPDDSIWYITRHEPEAGLVEMLKITPAVTACRLTIQVSEVAGGSEATITYSHTSLGAAGDEFVASFTEDYYCQFMQDWETRVNHYLQHGSALA